MILTDHMIKEAVESGGIVIEPFEERQIQAASYDCRVGDQGATTSAKRKVDIRHDGYLALEPGDFGVLTVLEKIELGAQYAARFGLRSKFARKGLIATTGPQIDPGYRGRLIIGLTNLTPKTVSLPHKDDLISIEFHRLEEPATTPYQGPYQDRDELGAEEIEFITESEGMALSEMLNTLRSLSENVGTLATDVTKLTGEVRSSKWIVPVIVTIGMAVIGIVIAIK